MSSSTNVRLWVRSRGTVPFAAVYTSVLVPKDAVIDDVRGALRKELSPLLDGISKAHIDIMYYREKVDDYIADNITRPVTTNPLAEVLSVAPGTTPEAPLYFEISAGASAPKS